MTGIPRYTHPGAATSAPAGEWVTYTDHIDALHASEQQLLCAFRQAAETHRVNGYFCSCGEEVNSTSGHLLSVISRMRTGA